MAAKTRSRIRIRTVLSILLNLTIFVQALFSILGYFKPGHEGSECFRFFTIDSNILLAVVSMILAVCELRYLLNGKSAPKWAMLLKYTGTVAVGLTFFTVIFFLIPTSEFGIVPLVTGQNLFLHILNPLTAMFSFVVLERSPDIRRKETSWCLLPTFVYEAVYLYKVMILKPGKGGWFDFYGFTMGGMWYLSAIAIPLATWIIGLGLWGLRKAGKKTQ